MQTNPSVAFTQAVSAPPKSVDAAFGGKAAEIVGTELRQRGEAGATGAELVAAAAVVGLSYHASDKAKTRLKHAGLVEMRQNKWYLTAAGRKHFAVVRLVPTQEAPQPQQAPKQRAVVVVRPAPVATPALVAKSAVPIQAPKKANSIQAKAPVKAKAPETQKPATETPAKARIVSTTPSTPSGRPSYRPHSREPFMCQAQQEYFRGKLIEMRREAQRQNEETMRALQASTAEQGDDVDRATITAARTLELRTRERQRGLVVKINEALKRIDEGEYGYCEETGEAISLARLEARPTATLSVEAQEKRERHQRLMKVDIVA